MNVTFDSIIKVPSGGWLFSWSGTGTWRVILWGEEQVVTTDNTFIWSGLEYTTIPPPLEVVPNGELALTEIHSPALIMQWYGEATADHYLIEQSLDGGANWRAYSKLHESGQWLYEFTTPILRDVTTYRFRVVAVGPLGDRSPPRGYHRYVVTAPVPPVVQMSYNSGTGDLTITGA